MRKSLLPVLSLFMLLQGSFYTLQAQKKSFTYEQLFKGGASQLTKPLPQLRGWADDEHYLEMRRLPGTESPQLVKVNVKTGEASSYTGNAQPEGFGRGGGRAAAAPKDAINALTSPDGKWVAYTKKDHNLYLTEIASGKETALSTDGSETIKNGYASWIYYEEILGRPSRYRAFWWSPDSRRIAYMRFDDSKVPVFPIYVLKDERGYLENERYPKPGDPNPEVKVGVVDVQTNATTWADFDAKEDQYFGAPYWTPAGDLWVQWMNRGQDNLKIYQVDFANGSKKEIYHEQQKAWIDLDESNRIEFINGGKQFLLKSDKDGWENIYLYQADGKLINQVTSGNNWGTSIVKVNEKTKTLYYRARRENSARFDFYKISLDGKKLTRLSFGDFSHDQVSLSPGEKYFITTYSNVSTPTTMALVDMKGKIIRELGNIRGDGFDTYALPRTEMVRVPSSDGVFELPMTITYPVNFDPAKKYPILVSIYGGPNAGTVYDRWPAGRGSSMWWAQEGIIQVSMDNRSSGHFGKKGLEYIHRQLGKWEIEDYMSCGKWLRQQTWTDTSKIAMTGGSFGGYMTCMALTYGADVFTHGVANASVTDWRLYDTHYTERFMDTPAENPDGYAATSVMTYAGKYKGLLRIVHGTSDDNVHMQNSLELIDKLQNLGKHFEFMLYPGERHGIGGNNAMKATHNQNEAFGFYYKNLLQKPVPKEFGGAAAAPRGF